MGLRLPWQTDDTRIDQIQLDQILGWCIRIHAEQHVLQQEIRTMSDTFAAELAAERAALNNLKDGVAAVAQRVSDLAAQLAAAATGSGPTEAQLAEMAADATEIQTAADALKAAAAA